MSFLRDIYMCRNQMFCRSLIANHETVYKHRIKERIVLNNNNTGSKCNFVRKSDILYINSILRAILYRVNSENDLSYHIC